MNSTTINTILIMVVAVVGITMSFKLDKLERQMLDVKLELNEMPTL